MKVIATADFLYAGKHVKAGSKIEVHDFDVSKLIENHVIAEPMSIEEEKQSVKEEIVFEEVAVETIEDEIIKEDTEETEEQSELREKYQNPIESNSYDFEKAEESVKSITKTKKGKKR